MNKRILFPLTTVLIVLTLYLVWGAKAKPGPSNADVHAIDGKAVPETPNTPETTAFPGNTKSTETQNNMAVSNDEANSQERKSMIVSDESATLACLQDLRTRMPNNEFDVEEIKRSESRISVVLRDRNGPANEDGFVRYLYSVSASSGEIVDCAIELHENR